MLRLKELDIVESREELSLIPRGKFLINTINAHSYNTAQKDALFAEALQNGDYLIPDGSSIVKACRWLKAESRPKERIAGWDLFVYEMDRLNEECRMKNEELVNSVRRQEGEPIKTEETLETEELGTAAANSSLKKTVMFVGSSEDVLAKIRQEASYIYHNIEVVTYSPPYKSVFSADDNRAIISAINSAKPDLLWIGMTAPKQEKWAYEHWAELAIDCHVGTIGAVFDFFAGTARRAPLWWQRHSLEWLYRLIIEPRRMWRRYLIGNGLFLWNILKEEVR